MLMGADGLPAVMIIVGEDGDASGYIGKMPRTENLLPKGNQ